MTPLRLAARLRDAGLDWHPVAGDRFVIPDRELDDEVFVLSNMTIQVYEAPQGSLIGFNGTTEWAMDDVDMDEALWLPREDQLRALLGAAFTRLERIGDGYQVVVGIAGRDQAFLADTPEEAYGAALLRLIEAAH